MELTLLHPTQIPILADTVTHDLEAMKWVAYYSSPEKWVDTTHTNRDILLIQEDANTIGFVDVVYDHSTRTAILDYCIFEPWRGQGKATHVIKTLHNWLKTHTNTVTLNAYVDPLNTPSIKTFDRAGYINHGVTSWGLTLHTYNIG